MNFNDIKKEIRQRQFRPIYFLQGEEPFFIDRLTTLFEQQVLTEAEKGFNQMVFYGKDTDLNTIINAAKRYPMMSQYTLIIVKEAQHIKNIADLQTYAKQPLSSTILVINYKYKSIRSNAKVAKAIVHGKGCIFNAKGLRAYQIPNWVQKYTQAKGYKVQPDALLMISEYLGTELSRIANELDKLMLNLGDANTITKQDVADNIGISKEYNIFEFQQALAQKDISKAFKIAQHFGNNPKSMPFPVLMGSLSRFFGRIFTFYYVKNQQEKAVLETLQLRSAYALKDIKIAIRHYSLPQLKNCIQVLQEYDMKSKGLGSTAPHSQLLLEMVYKLMV